jgi:hypothetical protein
MRVRLEPSTRREEKGTFNSMGRQRRISRGVDEEEKSEGDGRPVRGFRRWVGGWEGGRPVGEAHLYQYHNAKDRLVKHINRAPFRVGCRRYIANETIFSQGKWTAPTEKQLSMWNYPRRTFAIHFVDFELRWGHLASLSLLGFSFSGERHKKKKKKKKRERK